LSAKLGLILDLMSALCSFTTVAALLWFGSFIEMGLVLIRLKLISLLTGGLIGCLVSNAAKAEAVDLTLLFELTGSNTVIGTGTLIANGVNATGNTSNSSQGFSVSEFDATINGSYVNFLGHFSSIQFTDGVLTEIDAQASTLPNNNPTVTIGAAGLGFTYFLNAVPQVGEGGTIVAMSAAVPEASTWAMIILGFLVVGVITRRRKRPTLCAV
jgi:hypothetical protein